MCGLQDVKEVRPVCVCACGMDTRFARMVVATLPEAADARTPVHSRGSAVCWLTRVWSAESYRANE